MFDPRNPYHRRRWHYDSDQPLSVAQLIALGSLDARTAALLWVLVERHRSVIVSGPTDPMPGVGKTTTLNALLGFLPAGTTLVYTMGMYEGFDFEGQTDPQSTCVLANEVSDHLPIYMWGRVARQLLRLPGDGYAIATSCHADTLADVLRMLRSDLRLGAGEVGQLGVVVNIGLVGRVWPLRRRFLTVNYLRDAGGRADVVADSGTTDGGRADARQAAVGRGARSQETLALARWDEATDAFIPAEAGVLAELAGELGLAAADLEAAIGRREACLATLAAGRGANARAMREAVEALTESEASGAGSHVGTADAGSSEAADADLAGADMAGEADHVGKAPRARPRTGNTQRARRGGGARGADEDVGGTAKSAPDSASGGEDNPE